MGILQTAERSSHKDSSENVIFQRHLIAYKEVAKIISGTVLEVGSGEGYGIEELSKYADHYIAVDKYKTNIAENLYKNNKISFHQIDVPPLTNINDESVDFVLTFQVIEHIQNDLDFLKEIFRVMKPGAKLILTTPNKKMSLSRNPWHIREYTPKEMGNIIEKVFSNYELKGIFGNDKVMDYYNKNKESVNRIMKYDVLNMQYWLPRWILQIPYDILNRFNRQSLEDSFEDIVTAIDYKDYMIKESSDSCLDHFCIATK
tara:strand:+ start:1185 stop:1961 length:777 start_codon:yes stop_codon:yes gene_type:complete